MILLFETFVVAKTLKCEEDTSRECQVKSVRVRFSLGGGQYPLLQCQVWFLRWLSMCTKIQSTIKSFLKKVSIRKVWVKSGIMAIRLKSTRLKSKHLQSINLLIKSSTEHLLTRLLVIFGPTAYELQEHSRGVRGACPLVWCSRTQLWIPWSGGSEELAPLLRV